MSFQNLTVLCHGRTICDDFVFPETEWRAREAKARRLMEEKQLDGLLLFAEGALTRSNVCYLTNYHQFLSWGCSALLLPRDGKSKLVATVPPRDLTFIQESLPKFVELIPVGLRLTSNEHVCAETIKIMQENGLLDGRRWGMVNLEKMPMTAVEPWREVFPGGMTNCTEEFGRIRSIKSKNEIYALSTGSSIARTAVYDYLRGAACGANELALAADIDRQARKKGCESVSLLTYAGKENETMLRVPWDRNFEEGDTVSAFMCVSYLRYYGAFGATSVVGGRTDAHEALFEAAETIFAEKIKNMRDGSVTIGYEEGRCDRCGAGFYTVVNGVGMDLQDYPDIVGKKADVLENMTFTVSLSVKKKDVGSVFISKNMIVTDEGIFPMSGFGDALGS
ncbi:MAG: M24 family metallopeptidase [Oscillospiraceae bacterium]|jgi:Xaa-Pro aminopeptidase|nr:M24 family metallopeptidase [Oscillospiraceae bacterium]